MRMINDWNYCVEIMKKYDMEYTLFSDYVEVYNKKQLILGAFRDTKELMNYLLGYQSGLCDKLLYEEEDYHD